MTRFISRPKLQKTIAIVSVILALGAGSRSFSQTSSYSPSDSPVLQAPSAHDLANLVAPIALYPDALLGQVLVACTYPLEVVEAQQWLQQNSTLPNRELLEAARQQNWDPSVQALVAFPGVLALLNRNVRWTTDLGNAFLAQQADVMRAVQSLRAQAQESGQLVSTPQLSVNTEVQGDHSAIEIQSANPQIIYVPSYNPTVVWGTPAAGSYPALPYAGSGFGSLFSTIVNLAGFLPGFQGLLGLKSWGWALSWLAQALFVNNSFFNDFGFQNANSGYGESSLWVHDAHHRLGVPYGSSAVASRYGGGAGRGEPRGGRGRSEMARRAGSTRPAGNGWRSFGGGSQSFQRDNRTDYRAQTQRNRPTFGSNTRTPSTGQPGRPFSQTSRTTVRTNDRSVQANRSIGGDSYLANSTDSRARSFQGTRSFSSLRSPASSHDRFQNSGSARSAEPSRTAKLSSWGHLSHFSKAHMSSHGDSSHAPKPRHFSAPKFKAPRAPKFHGGGHASRSRSGSKSHRG